MKDEGMKGSMDCWIMEDWQNPIRQKSCVWQPIHLFIRPTIQSFCARMNPRNLHPSANPSIQQPTTPRRNLNRGYTAKGSLAEALTRAIGLCRVNLISGTAFEDFDKLHYEVENKLLHLIGAIEAKRGTDEWQTSLPTTPPIHPREHP